jgi:hypothetical protein
LSFSFLAIVLSFWPLYCIVGHCIVFLAIVLYFWPLYCLSDYLVSIFIRSSFHLKWHYVLVDEAVIMFMF